MTWEIQKLQNVLKKIEETKKYENNKKEIVKLEKKKELIDTIFNSISKHENLIKLADEDKELKELFFEEASNLKEEINQQIQQLREFDLTNEIQTLILEIRAGQGGDEGGIFGNELYQMYEKAAKKMNFKFEVLELSMKDANSLKEGFFEISGKNAFILLKHESGVHCVKRVPKTEKKGRIHTSTASVAILKEPTEVEININPKDLKIEVFRSSGPGGQSVNTTDSAVRITHIPTNTVVSQQDEKSQHKNKEKAMKILKTRIFAKLQEEEEKKYSQMRKEAVGTSSRNERIRTYHFTQNWVKDHNFDIEMHDVDKFMDGTALIEFLNEFLL